jgi:hypothetical protein
MPKPDFPPPPTQLWLTLPKTNQQRLIQLLVQLLERQLPSTTLALGGSNEPERE